ncbi:MAG: hypothetical protein A2033_02340 [Bacteroidetes bacterium GWA2_31_9]|nr:MAG: hypothetical protein A2033_02340 [Bacteroidetes bacterium GWA2_31_9]
MQNDPLGSPVYIETHQIATNEYGIANLSIGSGAVVTGVFADIAWGVTTHFVKTELDITGNQNYEFIGTSQPLSVPYALYAEKAGNASDDLDKDPTNEIQTISKTDSTISLSKSGGSIIDSDKQTLSLNNNELTISNGNTIQIPPDNDADTTNELQVLSVNNNQLIISKGNTVNIDADTTNEIQVLSFTNDTLYLSNSNKVYLGNYFDNSDGQTLILNGNELTISNGNTIAFTGAVDLDADPTNELQFLNISNDTLYLSNGNFVILPENFDNDSTNELQDLSFSGDTLFMTNGNFVVLPYDSAFWKLSGNNIYYNNGSVAIGILNPDNNAILDISSTNKGVLIPRLTHEQRDSILNPSIGLQIFNITTNCLNYWGGINWFELCGNCTPQPSQADANINGGDMDYYGISSNITMPLQGNIPQEGIGTWTLISNPDGLGVLTDIHNPNADFTGTVYITYQLRWSISTICDSTFDEFTVTFRAFDSFNSSGTVYVYPYSPENQLEWGGYGILTGASSNTNGGINTNTIVSILGDNGVVQYAAKYCYDLDAFGYDDWYLPTTSEMNQMVSGILPYNVTYWTSYEDSEYNAKAILNTGSSLDFPIHNKNIQHSFRCVRK